MFSYGEDNDVDFTNMLGSYGLFAPNASGKSTLLDAIAFCCFDRCSRTKKAAHVLNNKKSRFHCKFEFELGKYSYFIEISCTRYLDLISAIICFNVPESVSFTFNLNLGFLGTFGF